MGLAPVVIDPTLSASALKHSHYLIDNAASISDYHSEDQTNKDYTADGAAVAGNSDIDPTCFGTWMQPMKDWLQGPLHTVGLIDPSLDSIGLGSDLSQFQNGNCAYVLGFHFKYPPVGSYPVYYPPSNGTHQFLAWDGAEGSAPFQSAKNCTGNEKGPAVFLKDAANIQLSDVTSARFRGRGHRDKREQLRGRVFQLDLSHAAKPLDCRDQIHCFNNKSRQRVHLVIQCSGHTATYSRANQYSTRSTDKHAHLHANSGSRCGELHESGL